MSDLSPIAPGNTVAVVLAGGFGTRLSRILKDIPKPMAPAHGKPFVEWIARYLAKSEFRNPNSEPVLRYSEGSNPNDRKTKNRIHPGIANDSVKNGNGEFEGIKRIVLCTGHLAEVVHTHFHPNLIPGVEVLCVRETTPLGTGGAFVAATAACGWQPDAWLVCNGDSLILEPLENLFNALNETHADAAMIGRQMPAAEGFGALRIGSDEMLQSFAEKQSATGPSCINAGVYLFRRNVLAKFPAKVPLSFEYNVFPALLAGGAKIAVHPSHGPFLDIGTEQSLPKADAFIADHQAWFVT